MREAELAGAGLDLWVLGHTHLRYPERPGRASRVFLPGTPEPDGYDCAHAGAAWLLRLGDDGVEAEPLETGAYRFVHEEPTALSAPDLAALAARHAGPDAAREVLKVRLHGRIAREERAVLAETERALRARVLHLDWDDAGVREAIDRAGDRRGVRGGLVPAPAALVAPRRPRGARDRPRDARGGPVVILRRLRVHPFGRFADREVSFGPSLTVVLGPNEAGKSTLLSAVKTALFVPAKLSKPKFQEYLGRFLPVDGGDVVRVEIAFAADGGEYTLARRWGSAAGLGAAAAPRRADRRREGDPGPGGRPPAGLAEDDGVGAHDRAVRAGPHDRHDRRRRDRAGRRLLPAAPGGPGDRRGVGRPRAAPSRGVRGKALPAGGIATAARPSGIAASRTRGRRAWGRCSRRGTRPSACVPSSSRHAPSSATWTR